MRVFNFGSINIDHVYRVASFVQLGETRSATSYQCFLGGKGANQSLALARAGAQVTHIGAVDRSSDWVIDMLRENGVDVGAIARLHTPTGHAVIQVDDSGENCILIEPGANAALDAQALEQVLSNAAKGDWLLLQNETSDILPAACLARRLGLSVAFNPAPFDPRTALEMLKYTTLLIANGGEFAALQKAVGENLPGDLDLLITHGEHGAEYRSGGDQLFVPARQVEVLDTTGAGDTFIGYFLASLCAGLDRITALERATAASALCIGTLGAAVSIPDARAVTTLLEH